ncbi:hypothetical protein UO65_6394 [Actinokineospora spheciospongiae]|uniref:Uncharacterized protein n=1 Tax=Actinokineospora spheciospongiae TaxID=909613 RepID=W7ICT5_9PSEU|nr:hypothetical protein [Actinokineospora spheciospongiae]EWC58328.1 hypothetical protein UO65_6394 [Actinokineospora spheciospongiae]PWW61993.1 hypothetical protein DFQ13_106244 [Actinokineospora spheciospongiae]
MMVFTRKAVRQRRALATASSIERLVGDRVGQVRDLPEDARGRHADHMAELVLLAQAYRHFGRGWISKRELDRRAAAATRELTRLRRAAAPAAHLTDRD